MRADHSKSLAGVPGSRSAARHRPGILRLVAGMAAVTASAALAAACSSSPPPAQASATKVIRVVAAESVWGNIAAQIGGSHVQTINIVANPNADPRVYRPAAADRQAFTSARLLIINGAGFDPWADQLANSTTGMHRMELNVGDNVGVAPGGNPYLWYNPAYVQQVAALIIGDYARIDPADVKYFENRMKAFEDALVPYEKLTFQIRSAYAGTPVGASTGIVTPLAAALGLKVVTPPSFVQAMTAGGTPPGTDTATATAQITQHKIKLYLYDGRNGAPAVRAQLAAARAARIPVVALAPALTPAGTTFQQWQTAELTAIAQALATTRPR